MPEAIDITDFLLEDPSAVSPGDDVRVRPWDPPAPHHGGGHNPGPVLHGQAFTWGQPLTVDQELMDIIALHPALFMTEARYQEYQSLQSD